MHTHTQSRVHTLNQDLLVRLGGVLGKRGLVEHCVGR